MGNTELSEFMHESDGNGGDGPGEETVRAEAEVVAGDADPVVNEVLTAEQDALPDAEGEVELMVTQVDYTVEGSGDRERPVLHVFGRTEDNEAEHVRVHGFRPYFYAPTDSLSEDDLTRDVITGTEDGYESIRGEELTRIFGRTPRDVGNIRDEFEHYEADILFPNRLLIDKDITEGVRVPDRRADDGAVYVHHDEVEACEVAADLRVNTFDIEVDDRNGFPEDGEEPVVCLTSHDSYRDEYVAWLYTAPDATVESPGEVPGYDPLTDDFDVDVRVFDSEEAMHEAFLSYIEETDPDVLTGWNFDDFDAPYLIDRLDELDSGTSHDLDSDRLSRVSEVWTSGWGGPNVKGRVVFDLLYAYQRTKYSELDSYRLDAVGEQELGVGKERYPGDIGDLWEDDPERLLEYNLRDVELCVEIDRKQSIVAFWDEARKLVGCKLEDATTPGDAVDMYVLHKAFGNFVLPSKGQQEAEEFEGGAVFDPITGVRENVSVLDLKSLYPMSMVTINASPETKVDPETFDGDTYQTPTGVHFRKEPDGIIREMVDELLTEREDKKELRDQHDPDSEDYERYDRQQAAVKVIMNSLYGVFGWDRFRLYDRAMSAGVTSTNREVISFTEAAAEDFGYEVAYGDTDSVMLELGGGMTKEEAIEESFDIEDHINAAYDEFAREQLNADDHRFQIEFEKLYRRFFQAGKKKRYAGHIVWKEGKDVDDVDITGFEYQRSDIAPITKRVQKEVIDLVVREGDVDGVEDYVHGVIEDFREGEVDLDDIGIPGGIGKRLDNYDTDTAQVRGAKYANLLLGTNFDRGSKPKRLYLAKVHPEFFRGFETDNPGADDDPLYIEFKRDPDVICYEYADQIPGEFEVDYDKMLDKTLKGPIERILEALNISWNEVKSGQTQTGLGSFT
ncbi:DNA-directed DNA polymerase [Halobacterium jilantaiense]|uniref:DNA polymerase n=1 Tax=Halobacterium jilantaiense TaxID=355548 RepID=A0A1I0NNR9_9EURY|nr:DNA-directed DNA polymerase [Halobacterium jilantaiense]SEW02850.1 replicative DNA polymerase I [Halobacterium jilantaiense]